MNIPITKAAYDERKMSRIFPPLPFMIEGCSFLGEFWPQGLIIFGIHEDKDETKPLKTWVVGIRGYDEKMAESIDGYGGHWVHVADFYEEPSSEELELLIASCALLF